MSDSENSIKKSGSVVKVCKEVFDEFYEPTREEICEYAIKIGIDPDKEEHLLKFAKDGLMQPLPLDWKACYSDQYNGIYYYNKITKKTQWEHPLDAEFRIKADKARKRESVDISENNSQLDSGISSDNLDLNAIDVSHQAIFDKMDGLSKYPLRFLAPIEKKGALDPMKNPKRIGKFEVSNTNAAPQISLNISTTSEPTTPPYFLADKEPPKMAPNVKGFTLSGTGSMFLKSNSQKSTENLLDYSAEKKMSTSYNSVKGILRDSSLTDVRHKGNDLKFGDVDNEDKKSVRFILNDPSEKEEATKKSGERPASAFRSQFDKDDSSESSEDDEWDFHDNVADAFVKEIKVTPIQRDIKPTTQLALLKSNVTSDETIKRPIVKTIGAIGKAASTSDMYSDDRENIFDLFKKKEIASKAQNNQQKATVVKPLYDDSDSDSPNDSIKHSPETKDEQKTATASMISKLKQEEEQKKNQIQMEMNKRLETFKSELQAQQSQEESQIRADMQNNLEKLKQEILNANKSEIELFELEMLKVSNKEELQYLLDTEKEKFRQFLDNELENLKKQQDDDLAMELSVQQQKFDELLDIKRKDIEEQHLKEVLELRQCSESKLADIQQGLHAQNEEEIEKYRLNLKDEFEIKRQQISESHRAASDLLQKNHNEMLEELERDLKLEEDIIKKEHTTNLSQLRDKLTHELEMERHRMRETGEDRLYEKIRCEKRLLEDKYRCLKDKYIRLKTDVKISLERRNRRREQQQSGTTNTTGSETERSMSQQKSYGLHSQQQDNKNANNSISYNSETTHGKPPLNVNLTPKMQPKFRHDLSASERDKSQDRYPCPSNTTDSNKKFGAASKYLKHLQQYNNDDTTSVSDTTVSNNLYNRAKYIPGQLGDNGNSDSEAMKGSKNIELFNNYNNNNNSHGFQGRQRKKLFTRAKSASTSRLNQSLNRQEERPCTPVENLRRQLEKLEDLEDQFPESTLDTPYRLRYPFTDNAVPGHGANTSELDFFKHRIQIERDSLRRAKESLRTQRTNFRLKQRDIKQRHTTMNRHALDGLFQEEKELTEMEVSLHRTRALLGEKVIRLRHLECSLQRIYGEKEKPFDLLTVDSNRLNRKEDATTLSDLSSHSSSGFSSTDFGTETMPNKKEMLQESSEIILSLENLNAEIREIWDILSKQQSHGLPPPPPFTYAEMAWPLTTHNSVAPVNVTSNIIQNPTAVIPTLADRLETYRQMTASRTINQAAVITSTCANTIVSQSQMTGHYTTSLVERTRDLRNWLRQAKNEHEILRNGVTGIGQQTDL